MDMAGVERIEAGYKQRTWKINSKLFWTGAIRDLSISNQKRVFLHIETD